MTTTFAERLQKLPPYLFAEIDKVKRAVMAQGKDVINLGVGDPDMPTPPHIVAALQAAAAVPANHQYALDQGKPALRRAAAAIVLICIADLEQDGLLAMLAWLWTASVVLLLLAVAGGLAWLLH